ncbi:MAG: sigma-54 dependent transcriptional regulator [Acidobacteriia bacterium]|nr:sigma-54 dependent transcriptional regulator [Terriglobia bacterium]
MLSSSSDGLGAPLFLWDRAPARIAQIRRVLAGTGAVIRHLDSLELAAEAAASAPPGVALVALGQSAPAQVLSGEVIRCFRGRQHFVLGYEDSAGTWPLGARCRALLDGAQLLLDSSSAEFPTDLRRRVLAALQSGVQRRAEKEHIRESLERQGVIGASPVMAAVFRLVLRVSSLSDVTVLFTGETGTGKELLARAIHRLDPKRSSGPFVALNCAALTPTLAETELFGHRRGAFTGADHDRKGLFRAADGGVLFLDEIAELDLDLQAKLLRALQESRVLAVGEDREVAINARVLAASNQDLRDRVGRGLFRADLFHRLNVVAIHVPPLREHLEDVDALIVHFLAKHRSLNPARTIVPGADFVEALKATGLPGNARQLENLLRHAIAHKEDDAPLSLADLPAELWKELSAGEAPRPEPPIAREFPPAPLESMVPADFLRLLEEHHWNLPRSLAHCEQLLLEAALHRTRGNQSQTARLLGITPRSVYNKLRRRSLHG